MTENATSEATATQSLVVPDYVAHSPDTAGGDARVLPRLKKRADGYWSAVRAGQEYGPLLRSEDEAHAHYGASA